MRQATRASFSLLGLIVLPFLAWGADAPPAAQGRAAGAVTATVVQAASTSTERMTVQDFKKLRDPFKRPELTGGDLLGDRAKPEIERVAVNELTLVGVLTGPHRTRALVRAPSGGVFTVAEGTRIGTQNGYIRKVLMDRVIVNETVQDVLGDKEIITSELQLNAKSVEKGVVTVKGQGAPATPSSTGSTPLGATPATTSPLASPIVQPAATMTASSNATASAAAAAVAASAVPSATDVSASFYKSIPAPMTGTGTAGTNGTK